jgi:AhpD family alkylhydroperoxidase
MLPPVSDEDASEDVAAIYADIRATRGTDFVNDFWRVLAHDPALDPLVKEMIYVAVSITNGCTYCINTHTAAARAKGMTDGQLMELLGVVGMANETNRLVTGLQVPVDAPFLESRTPANAMPSVEEVSGEPAPAPPAKTTGTEPVAGEAGLDSRTPADATPPPVEEVSEAPAPAPAPPAKPTRTKAAAGKAGTVKKTVSKTTPAARKPSATPSRSKRTSTVKSTSTAKSTTEKAVPVEPAAPQAPSESAPSKTSAASTSKKPAGSRIRSRAAAKGGQVAGSKAARQRATRRKGKDTGA